MKNKSKKNQLKIVIACDCKKAIADLAKIDNTLKSIEGRLVRIKKSVTISQTIKGRDLIMTVNRKQTEGLS